MTTLVRAVVSVTRTKRRRFLWCAWWTREPCADPFRAPDAWNGGARSEAEALEEAERTARLSLSPIESRWAGAWLRIRAGLPAFPRRSARPTSTETRPVDPHATLGVPVGASLDELKLRFREQARTLHPDQGGDAAAFIAMKRAYDTLTARRARKR